MANHDPQTAVGKEQSGDMAQVVQSCNRFAFDLHSELAGAPGNLFFSPSSRAFVDVNEEGTEAAAATGIVMLARCAAVEEQPKIFRADHPFVFLIRDRKTRLIHFIGRVVNPPTQP